MVFRDTRIHQCRLQLASATHKADFFPGLDRTTIVTADFKDESTTVKIFRVFPQGLNASAEDVDAVFKLE